MEISAAYGIYPPGVLLQNAVAVLNQSGFTKENICVIVSAKHPLAAAFREANILHRDNAISPNRAAMMAWLMKFGAVMIPTVGLFIRSKEFLKALITDKACANSNGLVELGLSEVDAERFEIEMGDQGAFIYVASPNGAAQAAELLRITGARRTATVRQPLVFRELAKRDDTLGKIAA